MSSSSFQNVAVIDDMSTVDLTPARVTPALCNALAEQITRDGIGIIPGFFAMSLIDEAARFARDAVKANNGEYKAFGGGDELPGYLLGNLGAAPWFHELSQGIYRELMGKAPPPLRLVQVLRCLSGSTGRANSNYYHYDSYLLTLLVPLVIPAGVERGRLILFPNMRPIRRSYVVNAIEKAIFDRKWAQRLIKRRAKVDPRVVRIELQPGNLYAFCGYRSLHGHEPCGDQDLRATLLFHYANPHEQNGLRRAFRK